MAGDIKAAGDMVAQFTDMAARARRPQETGNGANGPTNNPAAEQRAASAGSSDAVALTDTASAIKQAERALADQPAVDSARVERIRAAIADGSYEIDAQRIADKLVDMESSLSGERT